MAHKVVHSIHNYVIYTYVTYVYAYIFMYAMRPISSAGFASGSGVGDKVVGGDIQRMNITAESCWADNQKVVVENGEKGGGLRATLFGDTKGHGRPTHCFPLRTTLLSLQPEVEYKRSLDSNQHLEGCGALLPRALTVVTCISKKTIHSSEAY